MTYEEFATQYPFETRKAAVAAIKDGRINGWARMGRFGTDERFAIHVIVNKPVPIKLAKQKRITARSICAEIFAKLDERDGDVDRAEFIDKAMKKGVGRVTAQTRYADLLAGRE